MAVNYVVLFVLCTFVNIGTAVGQDTMDLPVQTFRDISNSRDGVDNDLSEMRSILSVLAYHIDYDVITLTTEDGDDGNTVQLELSPQDLVGGCQHGECKFCAKKLLKFCIDAKVLKTGFQLSVTVGGHVFFNKSITVSSVPLICLKAPFVGSVCLSIYNVDLANRSACVGVQFTTKAKHKKINLKIKCFKLGGHKPVPSLLFLRLLSEGIKEAHQYMD